MTLAELRQILAAFAVAALGAALFWALGMPAPALTGAAAATSLAGLLGLRFGIPIQLRDAFFLVLGLNIGTGITPDVVAALPSWWVSLLALGVSLVATMAASKATLTRAFGFDANTAILASAPGHLSYVLGLGEETGADISRIALIQSVRLLILTLFVAVFVAEVIGGTGSSVLPPNTITLIDLGALAVAGALLGWVFLRLKLPAALLLAGMAVSAIGHGTGITPGRVPVPLTVLAFLGMGILIGSRFSGQTFRDFGGALGAGLVTTSVAFGSATIAGLAVMWMQGLPPALVITAFAPGGVEAMSAIGIALGLDPAYIAGHHVARLMILTALIPLFLPRR